MSTSYVPRADTHPWPAITRWAAIAILLIAAALRWANLLELPLFVDEATGISRAGDFWRGYPFLGMTQGKWLLNAIWALFHPAGPGALWVARAVVGLLSLLTTASAIGLGRLAHSRAAGLLAGLTYAVLPFSVFFDRQALADPAMIAFGGVVLVAALRSARRPRPLLVAVMGVALAASILTKYTAVVFVPVPVAAAILLAPRTARKKALLYAALATLLALGLMLAVFVVADGYLDPEDSIVNPAYDWGWLVRHSDVRADSGATLNRWSSVFGRAGQAVVYFIGWPLLVAGAASLAGLATRRWRVALWLWGVGVLPLLPLLLLVTWFPTRYLSYAVVPFVVLGAGCAVELARRVGRTPQRAAWIGAALALALVGWSVPRAASLVARPDRAAMPPFERQGYYESIYSGLGMEDVGAALRAYAAAHPGPLHVIYAGVERMYLDAYWGGLAGAIWRWDGTPGQQQIVARWLLAGESVAFLDVGGIPDDPLGTQTEHLGSYAGASGQTYRLRAVSEPGPEMLAVMAGEAFGHPEAHADDYAALVEALPPGERALIAYPPHQADVIAPLLAGRPVALVPVGAAWPLDAAEASRQMAAAASEHEAVSAVFFNEAAGDAGHAVERWLAEHLYRLDERWYGPLRVVDYVSPEDAPPVQPLGAGFGGMMVLDGAGMQRVATASGEALLVRLEWHAAAPVDRSYKVAVHVLDADNQIAAQHDGVPVGYLMPTDTWPVGEPVVDAFAIPLPGDLPPGRYEVRVAVYEDGTFARLPLDDGSGDSALIGVLE